MPTIDYTSKDFEGLRDSMLSYASTRLPEWTSRSEGDFGVVLVELMAYMGDILGYYGDRLQDEAYLGTATQRRNLVQIASMLGYTVGTGTPSVGSVTFQTESTSGDVLIPKGTGLTTLYIADVDGAVVFETDEDVTVPGAGGTATVSVTQGSWRRNMLIGTSDGTTSQKISLPQSPVLPETITVYVQVSDTENEKWSHVQYIPDAGPKDKVYSWSVDEHGVVSLLFGDGVNGAVPSADLSIYADFRVGGGKQGNLPAGSITTFSDAGVSGVSIAVDGSGKSLASATSGGTDPEDSDSIRRNAPSALRTRDRAVTADDFADFATSVPGVLKANARALTATSVAIYVMDTAGNPSPSAELLTKVQDTVQEKSLIGTTVVATGCTAVAVNLGSNSFPIQVEVLPSYSNSTIKFAVTAALNTLLSLPKVDFGMRITATDIYRTLMSIEGVLHVSIGMMARADQPQTAGSADLTFADWEIPVAGNVVVQVAGGGE